MNRGVLLNSDRASKKTWSQQELKKNRGCGVEHWQRKIHGQENLIIVFFLKAIWRLQSLSIPDEKTAGSQKNCYSWLQKHKRKNTLTIYFKQEKRE